MRYGPASKVCYMAIYRSSNLLLRSVLGNTMATQLSGAPYPQSIALVLTAGLVLRGYSTGWCFNPQSIAHGLIAGLVPPKSLPTWSSGFKDIVWNGQFMPYLHCSCYNFDAPYWTGHCPLGVIFGLLLFRCVASITCCVAEIHMKVKLCTDGQQIPGEIT